VTIPEDMITKHLNYLLESSDPGDSLHHLITVSVPVDEPVGPLGLPEESKLAVSFFAIAADDCDGSIEDFIIKVLAGAAVNHFESRQTILFAALSQEVWAVENMDAATRKMIDAGRLHEAPGAAESTVVYGAARDGRRWRSRRWLTGPKAGQNVDVEMLMGPPSRGEFFGMKAGRPLRLLVGQKQ
jgi:hypothetical protein